MTTRGLADSRRNQAVLSRPTTAASDVFRRRRDPSRDVADVVRHVDAVLKVLDEDLARLDGLLADPLSKPAEGSRLVVEETLHDLEHACAALDEAAADWRTKASLAAARGSTDLADQASARASDADDERRLYAKEIDAIRYFLAE